MSYRSERFNNGMRSVEESSQGIDLSKWRVLSDSGLGVERMVDELDREACAGDRRTTGEACAGDRRTTGEACAGDRRTTDEACAGDRRTTGQTSCACPHAQTESASDVEREDKLFEAEMRLAEAGKSYLIRVLLLIVENGADIDSSLRKVPRSTYFLHRQQLLNFFLLD